MEKTSLSDEMREYSDNRLEELNKRALEKKQIKQTLLANSKEFAKLQEEADDKGFFQGLKEGFNITNIPFFGGFFGEKKETIEALENYNEGKVLNPREEALIEKAYTQSLKDRTDKTLRYRIGNGALPTAKFITEFAVEDIILNYLTGGTLGTATTIARTAETASKASKSIKLTNDIVKGLSIGAVSAGIKTVLPTNWNNIYDSYYSQKLNGLIDITPEGDMFFNEVKSNPAKAFGKAMLDTFVSKWTEEFGEVILGKIVNTNTVRQFSSKLTGWGKVFFDTVIGKGVSEKGFKGSFNKLFNGLTGEYFEEWIENPIRQIMGLNDNEYNLENFLNSFKVSMDDFLLTSGLILMQGGISRSMYTVCDKLEKKKFPQSIIDGYKKIRSETEAKEDLQKIQLSETEEETKQYNEVRNKFKSKLQEANFNEKEIEAGLEIVNLTIQDGALNYGKTPESRINFLKENPFDIEVKDNIEDRKLGQFDTSSNIITIFKNGNPSTFIHEFGHYWRNVIKKYNNAGSIQAQKDLKTLNDYVGFNQGIDKEWSVEQEEKFAKSLEAYFRRGIAPTKDLQSVFDKVKEFMLDVYPDVRDIGTNISPEIINFFDKVFSNEIETSEHRNKTIKEIESKRVLYQEQGLKEEEINKKLEEEFKDNLYLTRRNEERKNSKQISEKEYEQNRNASKVANQYKKENKLITSTINNIRLAGDRLYYNIGEEVYYKLQKFLSDKNIKRKNDSNTIKGFIDIIDKMEEQDSIDLDYALKNGDINKINELSNKYKGFYEEYEKVMKLLDDLRNELIETGRDVGYIENYFPRYIKDYYYFRKNVLGISDSEYNKYLDEIDKLKEQGEIITQEDELNFIKNKLKGTGKNVIGGKTTNTKERKLEKVDSNTNQYYASSKEALLRYVSNMRQEILTRKFYGEEGKYVKEQRRKLANEYKKLKNIEETEAGKIKNNEIIKLNQAKTLEQIRLEAIQNKRLINDTEELKEEEKKKKEDIKNLTKIISRTQNTKAEKVKEYRIKNIEKKIKEIRNELPNTTPLNNSIAKYVRSLKGLNEKQALELEKTLNSVIDFQATTAYSATLTKANLLFGITSFKNSLKQVNEIANSIIDNGFGRTIYAMKNQKITVEDLGLENLEFDELDDSVLSKLVKLRFQLIAFNKLDNFPKNVYANAALLKAKDLLKQNDKLVNREIELIFQEEAEQVKQDILNDVINDNVLSYSLIKVAERQPLLETDRTLTYLQNPSIRFMYSLKSYALKQLNIVINDFKKMSSSNDIETRKEGLKHLGKYIAVMTMLGATEDFIIKSILGFGDDDPVELLKDSVIDNLFFYNIIGQFTIMKMIKDGLGEAIASLLFTGPLINFLSGFTKDLESAFKGTLDFDNAKSLKYVLPYYKDYKALKEISDNLD